MTRAITSTGAGAASVLRLLYTLAVLWLVGAGLRITVLAIPPVIPLIHRDLQLSQTDIGIVSGLPPLLFACLAIPGAALIARFGALRTLIVGLLLTAVAAGLRGASPNVMILFVTTFVMGAGIAIMQPALPHTVRMWLPDRIGFATAVYANGMLAGETLSASLTLPLVLPMTGNSWRLSLVFWSLPLLVAALLVALRTRRPAGAAESNAAVDKGRGWWPDWRNPLIWKVGLIMGCASSLYFGTNAFLPDYLTRSGRADLVAGALTILNASQILATVIVLFLARRLTLKRVPFLGAGLVAVISVTGLIVMAGAWVLLWCALIGFCCALTLTLGLSIPPLIAGAQDVHRVSAAVFTIGYLCAVFVPVVGGIAWDATGVGAAAFVPGALCGILIFILGATLDFERTGPVAPS